MRRLKSKIMVTILAGAILLIPSHSSAQLNSGSRQPAEPVEVVQNGTGLKIKLNFQDAPLQTVLEYLSEKAGLTVVSDEPVIDGRMTVISRQPITVDEAVSLINSVLKEKGLTTVLMGKTLKVVTLANAKKENIPVLTGRDPGAIVPGDNVVTYIVPVSHVTARALKENLQTLVPEYAGLEANEDGNALIITDTTANIKRLMEIVMALDTHMATVAEIRVFRLINASATSAANLINSMFQQQQQGGTRNQQGARGPFEMMMRGGPGGRGGFPGRDNNDNNSTSSGSGGSVNVQVVAAADDRTNSVVVRGPAEVLDVVADMIKALDDRTATIAGVKVFQLRYADALNVAQMINQLFGEEQTSSQNQGGGGPMMFRGPFGGGRQQQTQDDQGSAVKVSAAADSRTNTVVVTGPDSILQVVAGVVENLDSQLPTVADVKVFHLEYADAQDTAELINEVFGESGTSSRTSSSRSQQNQAVMFRGFGGPGGPGGFGGQQSSQSTGGGSDLTVIASADSRTNSVVVSGPPETLAIIAQVVKELDENPEQERRIFIYALKNASAENLKEILNNLFTEMQALNDQTTGRTGQQFQGAQRTAAPQPTQTSDSSSSGNDLSEETYIEADTTTNSLLVLTSSKNYDLLQPILDELHKPVGQVLIKVLFAEITHNDSVDLGTEFSAWNLRGTQADVNNVNVQTTFGRPTTGLQASVLDVGLDLTIHALQETGKLNILSRPYILTSNNETATITVGSQVPFATGETTSNVGTQTTTEYRDIGIILEVTPSINPDGLVNMTVRPEISTTTGESITISENLSLPVFSTRTSETKVAIRDGQTIVIGGLMQDETRDTISKVPLLGDIPLLGNLFKRTIKTNDKTELLIFLTPHVAPDALSLNPISEAERSRSNLLKDDTVKDIYKQHIDAMENKKTAPNEP